jgi:hypothetical protein
MKMQDENYIPDEDLRLSLLFNEQVHHRDDELQSSRLSMYYAPDI